MRVFGNVTYIENSVSKEMEDEMKMIFSSQNYRETTFPELKFHLFKVPSMYINLPPWEINFVIYGKDNSGELETCIYRETIHATDEEINDKCAFLKLQYDLQKGACFLGTNFHRNREADLKYPNR